MSIVNGFFGDYLTTRQNGLAIDMAFYHHRQPLPLTPASLLPRPSAADRQDLRVVHGLTGHEGVWTFPDPADPTHAATSYGALLHDEHGYAPLFLRYNSGLPIWTNGQRLAALLNELLASYPAPVQDLLLIGHSMAARAGAAQRLPPMAPSSNCPGDFPGPVTRASPGHRPTTARIWNAWPT